MNLDDFALNQIVLEIRYDNAYRLWDKCGELWSQAALIWPNIQPASVEPNRQKFRFEEKYEFSVDLNKTFIIASKCRAKEILEDQSKFIELVQDTLGIQLYNRIGTRFVFEKSCKDQEEKAKIFNGLGIVNIPQGECFNIEDEGTPLEFSFKKENDDLGVKVSVKSAVRQFEINLPLGVEKSKYPKIKQDVFIYDIDYYTRKPTSPGQLNIQEWVKQVNHIIRRDSKLILGE